MAIFGIVAAVVLLAAMEVPFLWRKGRNKELWIYACLMVFGLAFALAKSIDLPLPNPTDWIATMYRPVSKLVNQILP